MCSNELGLNENCYTEEEQSDHRYHLLSEQMIFHQIFITQWFWFSMDKYGVIGHFTILVCPFGKSGFSLIYLKKMD